MLEMTDQPDVGYRVSGGFGFDNRGISLEGQKEVTHTGWKGSGSWGGRDPAACQAGAGPTVADPSRQQKTNFIITIVRGDKSSILYKLKQSLEVRTLEKRPTL